MKQTQDPRIQLRQEMMAYIENEVTETAAHIGKQALVIKPRC